MVQQEAYNSTQILSQANSILEENKIESTSIQQQTAIDTKEDLVGATEDSSDVYMSKDGKRQAEIDAHIFAEEKRKIKEKYEKELKDARARELMYAEEAAILDKELNRERVKAAAALKSVREELEGKLRMELEQKVQI